MNWFERYGIVGMFFIMMTAIWFFCLFPEHICQINRNNGLLIKYIVYFCGLSFLPIGYLIMIFSQVFYYIVTSIANWVTGRIKWIPNSWSGLHCYYWKEHKDKIYEIENNKFDKILEYCEPKIEAILTYYDRTRIPDLERNKFLSSFITKRFDVIAINNGFIWAIILSFLCAIFLNVILHNNIFELYWLYVLLVIILSLLIVAILNKSKKILEDQIKEIGIRKLYDMKFDNNHTTQSNRLSQLY